jgi:catechol 2,3-dioxygenase-like lactoylglutathione lyase family enzyme
LLPRLKTCSENFELEAQMAVKVRYCGRLIDHIGLAVRDIEASRRFYRAVFEVLEVPLGGETPEYLWADELFISTADSAEAAGKLTGRQHIAFQAKNRETVDRFYEAGLKAGGLDNGAPGERSYHPGYYAAFLLDPDGNNIEAVYRGEVTRNADAVKVTF